MRHTPSVKINALYAFLRLTVVSFWLRLSSRGEEKRLRTRRAEKWLRNNAAKQCSELRPRLAAQRNNPPKYDRGERCGAKAGRVGYARGAPYAARHITFEIDASEPRRLKAPSLRVASRGWKKRILRLRHVSRPSDIKRLIPSKRRDCHLQPRTQLCELRARFGRLAIARQAFSTPDGDSCCWGPIVSRDSRER